MLAFVIVLGNNAPMLPLEDENKSRRFPLVNTALIVVNALIFAWQSIFIPHEQLFPLFYRFGVVSTRLVHQTDPEQISTILTALFLHANFVHLLANMWFLFLFGDNVEDRLGHVRYLAFYLLMGIFSTFCQVAVNLDLKDTAIGASGAVAGVMGAYLALFPEVKIKTWLPPFFVFEVPCWILIGLWFVLNCLCVPLAGLNGAKGGDPTDYVAHVGGFITGLTVMKTLLAVKQVRAKDAANFGKYEKAMEEINPWLKETGDHEQLP